MCLLEFDSTKIDFGDPISGSGQLNPTFPNQSIILSFLKPDGSIDELILTTSKSGSFSFSYKPEIIGDWIINTNWESEKSYYTSAIGTPVAISVEPLSGVEFSAESVLSLIIALIIIVIAMGIIIIFAKNRKKP